MAKQQLPPSLLGQLIGAQPCITFVTLGELTKWMEMRRWGTRNRGIVADWINRALQKAGQKAALAHLTPH